VPVSKAPLEEGEDMGLNLGPGDFQDGYWDFVEARGGISGLKNSFAGVCGCNRGEVDLTGGYSRGVKWDIARFGRIREQVSD